MYLLYSKSMMRWFFLEGCFLAPINFDLMISSKDTPRVLFKRSLLSKLHRISITIIS